jgi:hypothetical protein
MRADREPQLVTGQCSSQRANCSPAGEVAKPPSGEGGELVVVVSRRALASMEAHLFSGDRRQPVVGLARSLDSAGSVLAADDVRAIVGPGPRIYYLSEENMCRRLRNVVGSALELAAGGARVWWPGLSRDSDGGEHPLVLGMDGEPEANLLKEFERQFHMSHPVVRREVAVIDDLRRLAERELAQAREENRDMKIERHEAIQRAEAAEARRDASSRPRDMEHDEP